MKRLLLCNAALLLTVAAAGCCSPCCYNPCMPCSQTTMCSTMCYTPSPCELLGGALGYLGNSLCDTHCGPCDRPSTPACLPPTSGGGMCQSACCPPVGFPPPLGTTPAYPVPLASGTVAPGGFVNGSVVSSVPMMTSPMPVPLAGGCASGNCGGQVMLPQTCALPSTMPIPMPIPAAPPATEMYYGSPATNPQPLQVTPAPQLAPAPAEVPPSPIAPMHGTLPAPAMSYSAPVQGAPVQYFAPVGMQSAGNPVAGPRF